MIASQFVLIQSNQKSSHPPIGGFFAAQGLCRTNHEKPWAAIVFLGLFIFLRCSSLLRNFAPVRTHGQRYMQKVAMPCPAAQPCRFFLVFCRSCPADKKGHVLICCSRRPCDDGKFALIRLLFRVLPVIKKMEQNQPIIFYAIKQSIVLRNHKAANLLFRVFN